MKKKALITGITGQDGSYLTEALLEKGYEVYGIIRRHSVVEGQISRIENLQNINLEYGDVTDQVSLQRMLQTIKPDEIYNLAAQSQVRISFDVPSSTIQSNGVGVFNILEAMRLLTPTARFYQASSSEMFGSSVDEDGKQRETTNMMPVSPYGCAKLFGYHLTRFYRNTYNMFCANGILFNHESPRRGANFVTAKIVKSAVEIYLGQRSELELGNLDSQRDWGHSKDYVQAMILILGADKADDWVVATGQTHSIRDFCRYAFSRLKLNYEDYVKINPKFFRPQELDYLCGDPTKIKNKLGFNPTYDMETVINEMTDHYLEKLSK